GAGISDVYVIRTDKNGNTIWTGTYGGSNEDWGYSIQQTPDGGYIIVGYTESFGAGYINVYLIKTENDAGIEYEKEQNQKPRVGLQLNVYPNPFTTSTTIYFPSIEHRAESIELDIYDVSGRRVRDFILYPSSFILPAVAWDGKDDEGRALPPGTYFIRINEHLQQKIIKLR
ncbi:MAG: T9SS type A sorting domain-containing protein, partial [Candidatus Cloacimonadota bacterium]